jgi:phospholipase C
MKTTWHITVAGNRKSDGVINHMTISKEGDQFSVIRLTMQKAEEAMLSPRIVELRSSVTGDIKSQFSKSK